ncbi:hypothetical protein ACQW02_24535 [Humitalea sp. 24SJ18S-53]|uniref:hypothetical protein n=1 Tax=Humitalea sp. 24SJ18S-53 TaxID=3422307 RepID=UPI003D674671
MLAPDLVEEFTRGYVEEINADNRDRGSQKARLESQGAKLGRQIRNLLELIKEGHGSPAMVQELRQIEQERDKVTRQIAEAGTPERVPVLHPNLPLLFRRRVETLEAQLQDPEMVAGVAAALRCLIDAIQVFPGAKRGEVEVSLRGDLAAFLHLAQAEEGRAMQRAQNGKTPDTTRDVRGLRLVMATLDAGTRKHLDLLLVA